MTPEEIIEHIKSSLQINIKTYYDYGRKSVEVQLLFEGEVISYDTLNLNDLV